MENESWKKVSNSKNQKRKTKHKETEKKKIKWGNLEKEIPHIVLPSRARRLQSKLNIYNLEKKLLSDEFIDHQRKGWKYVKVLKCIDDHSKTDVPPNSITPFEELLTYSTLSLDNKWGDAVLFSMYLENNTQSS